MSRAFTISIFPRSNRMYLIFPQFGIFEDSYTRVLRILCIYIAYLLLRARNVRG